MGLAVGCGGRPAAIVVVPSSDRLDWASEIGVASVVPDPGLARRIERAASASGARILDVTVLAISAYGEHVPVVTLQAGDPATYMKHGLPRFLQRIGYSEPDRLAFVELVDGSGRFASAAGKWTNGGLVHSRPDLRSVQPDRALPTGARRAATSLSGSLTTASSAILYLCQKE